MKPNMIRVGLIFILIFFHSSSFSQLYDFDSLYENSSHFKQAIDNAKDISKPRNYTIRPL